MIFLHNYPHASFHEQGYVDYPWPNVPNGPGPEMEPYVQHWGASPDGIGFWPQLNWTQFPKSIRAAYEHCEVANIDPRRAVLEFKVSLLNLR